MVSAKALTLKGPWQNDPEGVSYQVRFFEYEGDTYFVRAMADMPGWPMCVKGPTGWHIGMASWEDWEEVAEVIRKERSAHPHN